MAFYAPGTIIPSKLHLYRPECVKREIFPFLDLPGEIRNKIYDSLFEEYLVLVRFTYQIPLQTNVNDHQTVVSQKQFTNGWDQLEDDTLNWERWQGDENQVPSTMLRNGRKQSSPFRKGCHSRDQPKGSQHRKRQYLPKKGREYLCHKVISPLRSVPNGAVTEYFLPFNFLLSNRLIYDEALSTMYSKTAFRFSSQNAVNKFLSTTPPRALKAIQALDLSHATEGEPELSKFRQHKEDFDKKWSTTCQQIGEKMKSLRRLRINLHINDWPSQLRLQEEWAQSILLLRGGGLDRVDAFLYHKAFSQKRLNEAAHNLEVAMMTQGGLLAKAAEEKRIKMMMLQAKKSKKAIAQAPRVLVIKMGGESTSPKVQKA